MNQIKKNHRTHILKNLADKLKDREIINEEI